MLETQLLFAKIAIRRTAESYVAAASGVATTAMLQQLAGEITANGPGATFTIAPLAAQCVAAAACGLKESAAYAVTGTTTGSSTGSAVAENVQTDVLAQETRTSIRMTVTITDAGGGPLVSRDELLTVRTFDVPPFAAVVGAADASAPSALVAEGDGAGCDPGNAATCDPGATAVDDTQIHDQRACLEDGNGGHCTPPGSGLPILSQDTFASPSWANGNIAVPGWAR